MRRLTHALLALAGVIMGTGVAVAAPVLHLSGWKASAGKPETFTITRVGGNGPATVMFRTTDGTAAAPIDYTAAAQTISWRNGQTTLAITVPTFVNMAKAGTNIAFTATISSASGTSSATGLIVEPPAPLPPSPAPAPSALTPGGFAIVQNWPGWNNQMVQLLAADESVYGWNNALAVAEPTVRRPWACHFVGQTRTVFFMPGNLVPSASPTP